MDQDDIWGMDLGGPLNHVAYYLMVFLPALFLRNMSYSGFSNKQMKCFPFTVHIICVNILQIVLVIKLSLLDVASFLMNNFSNR